MKFLKKQYGNIIFALLILLLLIPQTRMPLQVFVQRLIASSPKEIAADKRPLLTDYNWQLQNLRGDVKNLKEAAGKVVLVNYWATWCPPCIAEMPSLQKLYTDYKDKIDFYFVGSDSPEINLAFLSRKGYTLPVYLERSAAPSLLQTTSLPTTFIISKQGRIVVQKTGAAEWNSDKMRSLIDRLINE